MPAAATPNDEVELDVAAGAAAPAAAPDAGAPESDAPLPEDEVPDDVAPESVATGEAVSVLAPSGVDLDEAVAEAPVPATAEAAAEEATVKPNGGLEKLLYTEPGTCPKLPIEYVPAGKHEAELTPPVDALATYGDKVGANGKFPLPYDTIQNGGAYCVSPGSNNAKVTVGGMFFFEGKDGTCLPPPVTAAGTPCCTIYMWQPNSDGFYYDNCSMQCASPPSAFLEVQKPAW